MDLTASPIQASLVTASALLAAMIGILATLRRGHWLVTLMFSSAFLAMAAFQAGTLGMMNTDSTGSARMWASYLARVSALASWLWLSLSVVLARSDPWQQVRNSGAYLTLALAGCIGMAWAAGTPFVVRDVTGTGTDAVIVLGAMGKIYLMYLVVVMIAVVMNLERMLRTAQASAQRRLRPMFIAFLLGVLAELLVVSGGLLFGGLRVAWLGASAAPLFAAGAVTAMALARRRLSDMSVPLARPVIYYSSVSLTLAGAFLLTMAVLSKLLPMMTPEWKHAVSLMFYMLVGGGGLLLTLSPRSNRAVKRFIDRNFYANRYDYRREWERVSRALQPVGRPEDVARQIEALMRSVFDAERVAVYLRADRDAAALESDGPSGAFDRLYGPAAMAPSLGAANPLVIELQRSGRAIQLREIATDLDLIPLMAENRPSVTALDAAIVAPLIVGDATIGILWLSDKRGDEEYSYEDVEFLGAMARQLAAALWFARQGEILAETRQMESLHRLSTFVMHDIKNHVSGLSLMLENARKHLSKPEFQKDMLHVLERTVASLRDLMEQVSGVTRPPLANPEPCDVERLIEDAMLAAGLRPGDPESAVASTLEIAVDHAVAVDHQLLNRLLVNLLVNAREALEGDGGHIAVSAAFENGAGPGSGMLRLSVADNGRGMSEDFVRQSLFRPFSSTKNAGLGIGLAQCKSIVDAHGGRIRAESRPGEGTTFTIDLPVDVAPGFAKGAV
jgi:putative PEP-CTERM system histidine kinase